MEISNILNDFNDLSNDFRPLGNDIQAFIDLLNDELAARSPTADHVESFNTTQTYGGFEAATDDIEQNASHHLRAIYP